MAYQTIRRRWPSTWPAWKERCGGHEEICPRELKLFAAGELQLEETEEKEASALSSVGARGDWGRR
jgi:hypothetical protein